MTARFINPLILTSDLAASEAFYTDVFGLRVAERHEKVIIFDGGFALHDRDTMLKRINQPYAAQGVGAVYYFEVDNLDAFWDKFGRRLDVIHPPRADDWGGRVARVRDPEQHLLEIGERSDEAD